MDPQKAMGYLQRELAAVIDHDDSNETQEVWHFSSLATDLVIQNKRELLISSTAKRLINS